MTLLLLLRSRRRLFAIAAFIAATAIVIVTLHGGRLSIASANSRNIVFGQFCGKFFHWLLEAGVTEVTTETMAREV